MKQQVQIQIAEPCHENWNNMSRTEQGRFCLSCKKEVVDFSMMSDQEILMHISAATKSICGHADSTQLNRVLAAPPEPRKIWWQYWMGVAASFVMMTSRSSAQVKAPAAISNVAQRLIGDTNIEIVVGKISPTVMDEQASVTIEGTIKDENSNPVPFASVRVTNSAVGVAADANGNFSLRVNGHVEKIALEVSSVGYESKLVKLGQRQHVRGQLTERNQRKLVINDIKLKQATMGEVIIAAPSRMTARVGGLTAVCVRYPGYEKIKDFLTGSPEVKVYPNPVTRSNSFKLIFNLKDPGEYAIQFTDASGRVIGDREVNISVKNQLESFDGSMFRASGVYFASVTGNHTRKMYTTRLVVQ